MDQSAAILELAKQIASQNAYLHWSYWLALVALTVIASAGAAYFGAYFKQTAEARAIADKLDVITANLAATTSVTESIKSEFGMLDWRRREYETIRRTKLEELVAASFACNDAAIRMASADSTDDETLKTQGPVNQVESLALLYFPELHEEALLVTNCARQFHIVAVDAAGVRAQISALSKSNAPEHVAKAEQLRKVREQYGAAITTTITALRSATGAIQNAAANLMNDALKLQLGPGNERTA